MNVLDSVLAGIIAVIGLVIFYAVYNQYSSCLGAEAALFVIVPVVIAAGTVIYVLMRSFSSK